MFNNWKIYLLENREKQEMKLMAMKHLVKDLKGREEREREKKRRERESKYREEEEEKER